MLVQQHVRNPPVSSPLRAVRRACRRVAVEASYVHIDTARLERYALALAEGPLPRPSTNPADTVYGPPEDVVAYVLTLDTVNFGSGYSPWLRNKIGESLYYKVASALRRHFETSGPLAAGQLADMRISDTARLFELEAPPDVATELLQRYTDALNELGRFTLQHFNGSYTELVSVAAGSAQRLVEILIRMSSFNDVAPYRGRTAPFYKRAQLTVADLWIRLPSTRFGDFTDLNELTAFADNAVPHVLRTDGVLVYDEPLLSLIREGVLLPPGSVQEVEIRACTVSAVDMLVHQIRHVRGDVNDLTLDSLLWNRAHEAKYMKQRRHLTKTIFY